jgi:hypothetical protein
MWRSVNEEVLLRVYYFLACSVDLLIKIKLLQAGLEKLVDSQIINGNHMQTLSKGYLLPG